MSSASTSSTSSSQSQPATAPQDHDGFRVHQFLATSVGHRAPGSPTGSATSHELNHRIGFQGPSTARRPGLLRSTAGPGCPEWAGEGGKTKDPRGVDHHPALRATVGGPHWPPYRPSGGTALAACSKRKANLVAHTVGARWFPRPPVPRNLDPPPRPRSTVVSAFTVSASNPAWQPRPRNAVMPAFVGFAINHRWPPLIRISMLPADSERAITQFETAAVDPGNDR